MGHSGGILGFSCLGELQTVPHRSLPEGDHRGVTQKKKEIKATLMSRHSLTDVRTGLRSISF